MKWRVMVELGGVEGTVQLYEVSAGGSATTDCSAETLGLSVAEGKQILAGLQRHLVQAQPASRMLSTSTFVGACGMARCREPSI